MANESLLITKLPDGTFHVKETEAGGEMDTDPPIDQSVQSPDDVAQLVQQWLSDDADGEDPEGGEAPDPGDAAASTAAWNQEASKRGPSGFRK